MVIWKIGLAILAAANSPPGDILGTAKHVEFLRVLMLHNPEEVRTSHSSRLVFRPSARRRRQSDSPVPAFQRESLLQELVLSLALAGRERDALDELELCGSLCSWLLHTTQLKQCSYLPSPPYQDNSVLHTYAGLLCLRLALFAETDSRRGTQGKCKASMTHHNRVRIKSTPFGQIGQSSDTPNQTSLREAQQHLERARALDPEGAVAQIFIYKVSQSASCDSVPSC